ncbi:MAG: LTA synthase family protein [Bacteroidales bacterium]|nr:LTA synthase family protein [Bacteroidales bacterium]
MLHFPDFSGKHGFGNPMALIIALPLLLLLIRGGWGVAPVNVGSVYFSSNIFVNHAAINPVLSLLHDLVERQKIEKPVHFFSTNEVQAKFGSMAAGCDSTLELINQPNPNVVIIILESFGCHVVQALGGNPLAAPNLNQLIKEGVFFDNFYASGQSSRKGMVAILSGYPSQPKSSIMGFEKKNSRIPHLAKAFKDQGYNTFFLYGGNLDFAHMNSYLINGGFQKTISVHDFMLINLRNKWGVHDEVTFQRLFKELKERKQPVFAAYFSLSSHEPYDVPHQSSLFDAEEPEGRFYNSAHYTDSCLGDFINKVKADKALWDNTLFVVLADHSTRVGNATSFAPSSFNIPMLWLGGAVNQQPLTISTMGSQTDIYNTLCKHVLHKTLVNPFGKDLLSLCGNNFVFFTFNNGFSMLTKDQQVVFDNNVNDFVYATNQAEELKLMAKVYYQFMMEDYLSK